jgi:stress-induced morphogen
MPNMTAEILTKKLLESFPDARVKALDMTGGGDHWQVTIESAQFQGKSLVEQHQLVYKALGDWMKQDIHALALTTKAI